MIRFLFKGSETQFYDTDAIIHGTPENFLWATKSEIMKYLLTYPEDDDTNVKVGPLYLQCRNRNLKNNIKSVYTEEYIQVKWYTIKRFILDNKGENLKKASKISTIDKYFIINVLFYKFYGKVIVVMYMKR